MFKLFFVFQKPHAAWHEVGAMAMGDQERVQTRGLDHAVWPTEVHAVPLRPQMDFPKGTQANDSRCSDVV